MILILPLSLKVFKISSVILLSKMDSMIQLYSVDDKQLSFYKQNIMKRIINFLDELECTPLSVTTSKTRCYSLALNCNQ